MADNSPYDLPNKGLYWPISIRRRFTSSPRKGMKLAVFQRSRLGCQGANYVNCSGYIFGSLDASKALCEKMAEARGESLPLRSSDGKRVMMISDRRFLMTHSTSFSNSCYCQNM